MIFHSVSHLLPELWLACWAVGLLILELFGISVQPCHRITVAGLIIGSITIILGFSLPSVSLFDGLLYTSNWSSFTKLVLLIFAGLAWQLQSGASTRQLPTFFLLTLLLSAFILVSATNLWLISICYFWCFISLFFIDAQNVAKAETEYGHWLQSGIVSVLIMTFGVVFYLFITKEANWLMTPGESIRRLTIPTLMIFSGLRYLVLNNYPLRIVAGSSGSIAIHLLFMPLLEVLLLNYLLLPTLGSSTQAMIFPVIGIYGLGLGFCTIFKIKSMSSSAAQFLIASLPIQNCFVLLAFAQGNSNGFAIGVYYSLFYLLSIWVLLKTEEQSNYAPARFIAWFNLAGLPLTPGFALRLETVLTGRHHHYLWLFLVILLYLLTFWVYTHHFRKDSNSVTEYGQSAKLRISSLWQWVLVLFFMLNGILWRFPLSWLRRLFLTINPY